MLIRNFYFSESLSRGFVSLFLSKTIIRIANGLLGIFLPIFVYRLLNNSFQGVVYYYLIGYILYGSLVVWGAQFLNRFGFRRSLKISTFLGAFFYFLFYFLNENNSFYLLPISLFALFFYRILFWVPYHVDFAKFTTKNDRAAAVGLLWAMISFVGIFTPAAAGFVIERFGFNTLFVVGIILYLSSFFPYLMIPPTNERFSWSFRETWRHFFSREKRRMILAFMADGAEGVIGLVVWPIFIFNLLGGDYMKVGIISTFIVGTTVFLQLLVGKYAGRKIKEEKIFKFGSVFYSLGWVLKIFIVSAFHIFIVDAYHKLMNIFMRIPFDAMTYELAADQGHYVDEFTVLHEMAVNLGASLMLCLVLIVSSFFVFQWAFFLAAIAAILVNLFKAQTIASEPALETITVN